MPPNLTTNPWHTDCRLPTPMSDDGLVQQINKSVIAASDSVRKALSTDLDALRATIDERVKAFETTIAQTNAVFEQAVHELRDIAGAEAARAAGEARLAAEQAGQRELEAARLQAQEEASVQRVGERAGRPRGPVGGGANAARRNLGRPGRGAARNRRGAAGVGRSERAARRRASAHPGARRGSCAVDARTAGRRSPPRRRTPAAQDRGRAARDRSGGAAPRQGGSTIVPARGATVP